MRDGEGGLPVVHVPSMHVKTDRFRALLDQLPEAGIASEDDITLVTVAVCAFTDECRECVVSTVEEIASSDSAVRLSHALTMTALKLSPLLPPVSAADSEEMLVRLLGMGLADRMATVEQGVGAITYAVKLVSEGYRSRRGAGPLHS